VLSGIAFGTSISFSLTCENVLVMKYSLKVDREKNTGLLKAAGALAIIFTPLMISMTTALW
jgi:hypothetical protein